MDGSRHVIMPEGGSSETEEEQMERREDREPTVGASRMQGAVSGRLRSFRAGNGAAGSTVTSKMSVDCPGSPNQGGTAKRAFRP